MKTYSVPHDVLMELYTAANKAVYLSNPTMDFMNTVLSPSYDQLVNGRLYLVDGEVARLKSKQSIDTRDGVTVEICVFQKHKGKPFVVEADEVEFADGEQVGKYLGQAKF